MLDDRKKPGWAFWTTVVVASLPLLYVASFGPACWLWSGTAIYFPRDNISVGAPDVLPRAATIYWPMGWLVKNGPSGIGRVIKWYARLRIDDIRLPTDPSGGFIDI
jgi:hypothetical protein